MTDDLIIKAYVEPKKPREMWSDDDNVLWEKKSDAESCCLDDPSVVRLWREVHEPLAERFLEMEARILALEMEARILADAKIIKAAEELAYRAEVVFKSEYHNTKHIEGAAAYYEANLATLTDYRDAVNDRGRGAMQEFRIVEDTVYDGTW
jgi:hypothetical protein